MCQKDNLDRAQTLNHPASHHHHHADVGKPEFCKADLGLRVERFWRH